VNEQHLKIPIMFHGQSHTIFLSAMIDSGASSSFINKKFILKNNMKTHKLPKNIPLYNIDNSPNSIGLISEYAILKTQISKERKNLIFLVVDIGQEDVILGIDWLRLENPIINWKEGRVEIGDLEEEDEEERLWHFLKEEKAPWLSAMVELPLEYQQYSKVFSEKESQHFPLSKPYNHKIDLVENAKMKRSKVYPLSIPELKELDNYLEENLKKGYIRKSQSPFASPFFFIPKKNGKLRPIVDYRKLNLITVKNSYPLPLISSIVDGLSCARLFTKLDLRWGYNNVLIKNGHQE
jgi:predicted aspartyl protease